jgi:MFS family permease
MRGTTMPSDSRTFISLALQAVVNAFVYSTYLARLPDIRDQAGISVSMLGVVMTVGNLVGFLGCFITTAVVRWLGSKWVMIAGGTLYVFALPVIGSSHSAVVLVTAIVVMMLMNVLVDVGFAMQSTQFSARRGQTVMGRMSGLYSIGTIGGGLAAAAIAAAGFDVSVHLFVLASVLAAALIFVGPGLLPVDERPDGIAEGDRPASPWRPPRVIIILGLASAMAVPLDVVPGEWATFRMRDDLGATTAAGAAAYLAFTIGMAAGRLGADWAAVHIGRTRLARLGPIVSAAGLILAATVPGHLVPYGGFLVAGLGVAAISPLLTEAAGRAPGPPGAGFRALFIGNRLAGMLTPVAVGTLAGTAMSVGAAMVTVVVPCAALLLILAVLALRHRVRSDDIPLGR